MLRHLASLLVPVLVWLGLLLVALLVLAIVALGGPPGPVLTALGYLAFLSILVWLGVIATRAWWRSEMAAWLVERTQGD